MEGGRTSKVLFPYERQISSTFRPPCTHTCHSHSVTYEWPKKKSFWIQSAYSYPRDLSLPLLMIVYTLDTFNLLIREETYLSSHRKHLLVVVVVTNWVFQNPVFRSFFGEYLNSPPFLIIFVRHSWKIIKNTLFQFALNPNSWLLSDKTDFPTIRPNPH